MRQIGNLTSKRINMLWPNRSKKVFLLSHIKNEEHSIERMVDSAFQVENIYKVCILIDDKTTDATYQKCIELKDKYKDRFVFKYFSFAHNFAIAKNECIKWAEDNGLAKGDWVWYMGGDFMCPKKTAKNVDELTSNPNKVIARFEVSEFHSLKNHTNPLIRLLMFWFEPKSRPRILLVRHRKDIKWDENHLVHENFYWSFYRITRMGEYFEIRHGIENIGTLYHFAQQEDSPSEILYKDFYYQTLWSLQRRWLLYNLKGDYKSIQKQLMEYSCRSKADREAANKGWDYFVPYLTREYMKGRIPKGLTELYRWTQSRKRLDVEYG
jgi:glycosyltransferase involved in cell wall biosynthesis